MKLRSLAGAMLASPGRPAVAGRDKIFCIFLATLLSSAASAGEGVTVSRTAPGGPIALGAQTTMVSPIFRPVPRAAKLAHCFVVVEGPTASRPVGAGYEVSIVSRGMDASPDDVFKAGTLSFYEAVGVPAAKTAPVSFEVPAFYCRHDAYLTLRPAGGVNAGSHPSIASVSLVAR